MIAADQMTADIELWERAIATQRRLVERARRYGDRPPDPLAVPLLVQDILAERQRASLQPGRTQAFGVVRVRARSRTGSDETVGLPPLKSLHQTQSRKRESTCLCPRKSRSLAAFGVSRKRERAPLRFPAKRPDPSAALRVTRQPGACQCPSSFASRREGLSASAWVRRLILERTPAAVGGRLPERGWEPCGCPMKRSRRSRRRSVSSPRSTPRFPCDGAAARAGSTGRGISSSPC